MVLLDDGVPAVRVDAVMADRQPALERLTTHLGADHGYGRILCRIPAAERLRASCGCQGGATDLDRARHS
jgi:hypothetical protein